MIANAPLPSPLEFRLVYMVMCLLARSVSGDGRGSSLQFLVRSRTLAPMPCYYKLS